MTKSFRTASIYLLHLPTALAVAILEALKSDSTIASILTMMLLAYSVGLAGTYVALKYRDS
ncbi:hypothetical protein NFC81_14075 [Salinispirillum sp. LH 10-3-1]|uniref:Uncharacterized protein n=1 Tax=Salinispirillum sp. LH 10-3-1 TaxID=2952525 RepID=A0AB38YFG0_9GAMM